MVQVSLTGPKTPSSKLSPIEPEPDQNISVFVRCRPLKSSEKRGPVEVVGEQRSIRINDRLTTSTSASIQANSSKLFTYDSVFSENCSQIDVYRTVVAPLIQQVIYGYNCTVFAYGQTGTGKTFTMEGDRTSNSTFSWEDDPLSGIIPRALHQLFETLTDVSEYIVRVSFLELYNEELYDLLSALDDTTKLKVFDDPAKKGSVFINGLEEITVENKEDIYEILRRGSAKRQTASTLLNACSSRSHTIFSVTVHIKESSLDGEELMKVGKLNLVDLAGSENIGRSGAMDKRAREAGNINQSLLTLGRVITSLVEKSPHIPYRESKLTRLLKDSLGGRTKTSIIATISPNFLDFEDTLSTLEYAQRAKKITNKPEINQKLSKKTLLREYAAEIERLRRDLNACREKTGFFVDEANYNCLLEKLKEQTTFIEEKQTELFALKNELDRYMQLFNETRLELDVKKETLQQTEAQLNEKKYILDLFIENEQKLFQQATILQAVVKHASDDANKLLKKSTNLNEIEEKNFTEINDYEKTFEEKITAFFDTIEIGSKSTEQLFVTLEPKITENFLSLSKKVIDIQDALKCSGDIFNKDLEKLNSEKLIGEKLISELSVHDEQLNEFHRAMVVNMENFIEKLKTDQIKTECMMNSLLESIGKQNNVISNMILKEKSRLADIDDNRKNLLLNFKQFITNHINHSNENVASIKMKLNSQNEQQLLINEEMNATIADVIKQITILNNKCSDNSLLLRSDHQIIIETLSSVKSDNDHASENIDTMFDAVCSSNQVNAVLQKEILESVKDVTVQYTDMQGKALTELKEDAAASNDSLIKSLNEVNKNIGNEMKQSNERTTQLESKFRENLDGGKILLKEFETEFNKNHSKTKEELMITKETIEKSSDEVKENLTLIKKDSRTWWRALRREITHFNSIGRLVSRLGKYAPTGFTPKKCDYDYPNELIKIPAENELINNFREELLKKQLERNSLNEDCVECESETNSMNSTSEKCVSLNNSDIENKVPLEAQNLQLKESISDSNLRKPSKGMKKVRSTGQAIRKKLSVKEIN